MITIVEHPLINYYVSILRKKNIACAEYRAAARGIAYYLAFEATRSNDFNSVPIINLEHNDCKFKSNTILIPILRSGMAMLEPFTQILHKASVGLAGFIRSEKTRELDEYYFSIPSISENTNIIILEPTIATGDTICATLGRLQFEGAKSISVVTIVISEPAAERIRTDFPDVRIITAAIDPGLDDDNKIVPGIGSVSEYFYG